MKNKRYKKLQHKINRAISCINENVANDDLWRGRFYARQKKIYFYTYADKSGVCAVAEIQFIDKKTGAKFSTYLRDLEITGINFNYKKNICGHKLWELMNDFVCNATRNLNIKEYKAITKDYTEDKRWTNVK